MLKHRAIVVLAAAMLTAATAACTTVAPAPPSQAPGSQAPAAQSPAAQAPASVTPAVTLSVGPQPEGPVQQATVEYVTDGDTIHVVIGGTQYRLRYIGMNAPETVDPDKPVEPGGPQASERNKQLVGGQQVYLEKDVSDTDQFGRLLRYVWLKTAAGWLMVDRELVLEGWAFARDYPPDTKYHDTIFEAQSEAKAAGLGLWGPQFQSPRPTTGGLNFYGPAA